ncbi:MAG: AAA-like domain-containing protein, partial [Candidatus Poribacteria bacterium]|nr:AAA-like domain-containing protein [Candidatus Poribacteria bacterium]
MRRFGTQGRVYPGRHYIVPRSKEVANFLTRVRDGRYIVLFAPRQTGKTTFFRMALDTLANESSIYFPIQLNFEAYKNLSPSDFYEDFCKRVCKEIEQVFEKRGHVPSGVLTQFLENAKITNHISMIEFFEQLSSVLNSQNNNQKVVVIIDEFDGIPQSVLSDFLHSLRNIYLSDETRCPYSVGIIGVKSIAQLNYDRSVSPFNIQDEFHLPNFTLQQVQELFAQYTDETGQPFSPEVIEALHKQTAGQPFLVNRFGQILTEELNIPKNELITMEHFSKAHVQLIRERNTNIDHLITNIRRDQRF